MCAKVPKAKNRQNNNSADESMAGKKLKTTMALDSTDFYHVKYLGRILKITHWQWQQKNLICHISKDQD